MVHGRHISLHVACCPLLLYIGLSEYLKYHQTHAHVLCMESEVSGGLETTHCIRDRNAVAWISEKVFVLVEERQTA
jgi:hypothetical protein